MREGHSGIVLHSLDTQNALSSEKGQERKKEMKMEKASAEETAEGD